MQEFFSEYGLWLLVALLVLIALFLLFGGKRMTASTGSQSEVNADADSTVTLLAGGAPALISPVGDMMPVILPPEVGVDPEPKESKPTAKPKAEAKPAAETKVEPRPKPAAKPSAAKSEPDNLLLVKGIGPKVNGILNDSGITRFDQIAAWKAKDLAEIDAKLGTFAGRPERDNWVDQAKLLAKGDTAGFEAKYGKL